MTDLEKSGPDSYYFTNMKEGYSKLPQIVGSHQLQYTSFGDTALETVVNKGISFANITKLNRLLLTIDSGTAPRYYLNRLSLDKLLEIYFLDLKALEAMAHQSPLLKVTPRNSILRN